MYKREYRKGKPGRLYTQGPRKGQWAQTCPVHLDIELDPWEQERGLCSLCEGMEARDMAAQAIADNDQQM